MSTFNSERLKARVDGKKETVGPGGRVFAFVIGSILTPDGNPIYRYSRSAATIRARFRITLQALPDPSAPLLVFDAIQSDVDGPVSIRAENEPAQQLWNLPEDTEERQRITAAIEAIFRDDL